MTDPRIVSSIDLMPLENGPFTVPSNSSNSKTEQSAAGTFGGSTHLACAIRVNDPGDNDHAFGGVESTWYFLTKSPSSGPLRLGVQFGAISLRASGRRNNEWGWSSNEVYASLSAVARSLNADAGDLPVVGGADASLISFWNLDLGPQNEARIRVSRPFQEFRLNQDSWDKTVVAFPPALSFRYPSQSTAEGDFLAFVVGFRLSIHAPCINDYDFRLATESMASIAWVTLDSES